MFGYSFGCNWWGVWCWLSFWGGLGDMCVFARLLCNVIGWNAM